MLRFEFQTGAVRRLCLLLCAISASDVLCLRPAQAASSVAPPPTISGGLLASSVLVLFLPWVDVEVNRDDDMASTAALEQEEFDDAFWREVDAAEAAAVLEQQGQNTSSSTRTVGEDLSPTMTPPQKRSNQETCQKDGSSVEGMLRYRWKVACISVHGDGSKIEEEWIGEVRTPWQLRFRGVAACLFFPFEFVLV